MGINHDVNSPKIGRNFSYVDEYGAACIGYVKLSPKKLSDDPKRFQKVALKVIKKLIILTDWLTN